MTSSSSQDSSTAPSSDAEQTPIATAQPAASEPSFGWNEYAEKLNGRFAMVGFLSLLLLELFTRQDFFSWIGL